MERQVEPLHADLDGVEPTKIGGMNVGKRAPKRKMLATCLNKPNPEEKQAKIAGFRKEIDSLVKYFKNLMSENRGALLGNLEKSGYHSTSMNNVIACLMEGSDLPLLKLVDEIFEKVKGRDGNGDGFTKASVKSSVLMIGQRLCYGVFSADADVLEDEAERALWCWETRDLKLMPKSLRASLKAHRTCRSRIQKRISAVLEMITALEMSEILPNCEQKLMKASDKLSNVLNEANIRLLMENMSNKNDAEMAQKEAKRREIFLIKQMEKDKREKMRDRKRIKREHQKEMLQSVKELKRMHGEAQREEKRCEKEEIEKQKQLKRQQEQAEKDQRRREKEEAESKKRLVIQKQVSFIERFLKRNKTSSCLQDDRLASKGTTSGPSSIMLERNPDAVTISMDTVMAQNDRIDVEDIWKSHLNAWRSNRCSTHSNRKRHWGIRQKPKVEMVKELKLTTNKEPTWQEDLNTEKLVAGLDNTDTDRGSSQINMGNCLCPFGMKRVPIKLLQFDNSHRPAFYGVWPRNSQVVGPRHPFVKDPEIIYEIDSDEEWAEDEPGENLSDFDKDDDDESMGEHMKDDEEEESADSFFVPDGYLSENEGQKAYDEMEDHELVSKVLNLPTSEEQLQSDEFCTLLRQQKYLNSLTEHALKKNQPMIILNLMHEKTTLSSAEELTGTSKLERLSLQTLGIRPFPGFQNTEISAPSDFVDGDQKTISNKSSSTPLVTAAAILDSDLPHIVKKETQRKHGLFISPEKGPKNEEHHHDLEKPMLPFIRKDHRPE